MGCGLLDLDFMAVFDWLDMQWTYSVLQKKNCNTAVVSRLKNIYADSKSVVVVNNVLGKAIPNNRGSLRQGDPPSMFWFAVGLDPVLHYLERRLVGIPVFSLPVAGPNNDSTMEQYKPEGLEERYKLCAYADDVKCGVTSMEEVHTIVAACTLLERAAGVKLHRAVDSGKVKFLPLSGWKTLTQDDMPYNFIMLSDILDFIGFNLKSSFSKTRKVNCEIIEDKIKKTVGPWKGGKFQHIVERGHSANQYALSKVYFRCSSIPLRAETVKTVHSQVRGWILQDCFIKPSAIVLHRSPKDGGLGLHSVQCRALANLLRTFCELACHPQFLHSLYLSTLYKTEVLGEWCAVVPPSSPYYDTSFFNILRYYMLPP